MGEEDKVENILLYEVRELRKDFAILRKENTKQDLKINSLKVKFYFAALILGYIGSHLDKWLTGVIK